MYNDVPHVNVANDVATSFFPSKLAPCDTMNFQGDQSTTDDMFDQTTPLFKKKVILVDSILVHTSQVLAFQFRAK